MKKEIKDILDELYILDNSLKEKENDLIKIISKMLEAKPKVKIDETFKKQLKEKILSELNPKDKTSYNFDFIKIASGFLSGALVVSLILFIYPDLIGSKSDLGTPSQESVNIGGVESGDVLDLSFSNDVSKSQTDNAFGRLELSDNGSPKGLGGVGGGGGVSIESTSSMIATDKRIMPVYNPKSFNYILKQGEKLPSIPEKMYVYKVEAGSLGASNTNIIGLFKSDTFDVSKLNNAGLSSFMLYENSQNGYNFGVDLTSGQINISRNYDKWPTPDYKNQERLTLDTYPSKEKILSVVYDFIDKYSIKIDGLDAPYVDESWKKEYKQSTDRQYFYIPDFTDVIFQQFVDGVGVYEKGGTPSGINVGINIRDMNVEYFGPITKHKLEGSNYDLISDTGTVITELNNTHNYNINETDTKTNTEDINIEVGKAKLVYVRSYLYKNNKMEQYYVPSIRFEIIKENDSQNISYLGQYLTIPIVKDFIENNVSEEPPMLR